MVMVQARLQIDELLTLQDIDNLLGRLETERENLERGERVERALALRQARRDSVLKRLQAMEAEQRDAELELKGLEAQKHDTSRELYEGRITNHREAANLERELAALERQRLRLDEQILRREELLIEARTNAARAEAAVEDAEKALAILRKRSEKEEKRINSQLAELGPRRQQVAGQLDPATLAHYETIRRQNHNVGAVRVKNGACGGCRMMVGAAMLRRVLAGGDYVYCESCNRFLFPTNDE